MAEFEELRLQVTLVDQASVALSKLNAQIKDLGGGSNKAHMEDLARRAKEVSEVLKGMDAQTRGVGDAAQMATTRLGVIGGVISAIGAAAVAQAMAVRGLAVKLQGMGELARSTGFAIAEVDEWTKALERVGISQEQAAQTIVGISRSMADILRPDSRIVQQLTEGEMTGNQRLRMNAAIAQARRIAASGRGHEFGNFIVRTIHEVLTEGVKTGKLTPQQAAEAAEKYAGVLGVPALANLRVEFREVSQDQIKRMEEAAKAAEKFNLQINSIWINVKRIIFEGNLDILTNQKLLLWMERFAAFTGFVADNIARWQKEVIGPAFKGAGASILIPGGQGTLTILEFLASPRVQEFLRAMSRGGGSESGSAEPQRFMGGGAATDAAEERDRHLVDVSSELKRLNDYLTLGIGGSDATGAVAAARQHGVLAARLGLGSAGGAAAGGGGGGTGGGAASGGAGGGGTNSNPTRGTAQTQRQAALPSGATTDTSQGTTPPTGGGQPSGGGSAYLANQRAAFRAELQNPQTRELLGAIISAENPGAGPAVAESLMNRTAMVNGRRARQGLAPLTLRDMIVGHPSIGGGKSFYGPMRSGAIQQHLRRMRSDPAYAARMNALTDRALGGSNTIEGYTDQGSAGDPNFVAGGTGINIKNGRVVPPGTPGAERFNNWGYRGSAEWRLNQQRKMREFDAQQAQPTPSAPNNAGEPDRSAIDRANSQKVQTSGRLNIDVDAPRNTRVSASGHGLMRRVIMNRRMPLEQPAAAAAEE